MSRLDVPCLEESFLVSAKLPWCNQATRWFLSRLQKQESWPSSINRCSEKGVSVASGSWREEGRKIPLTMITAHRVGEREDRGPDGKRKGGCFIQDPRSPGINTDVPLVGNWSLKEGRLSTLLSSHRHPNLSCVFSMIYSHCISQFNQKKRFLQVFQIGEVFV